MLFSFVKEFFLLILTYQFVRKKNSIIFFMLILSLTFFGSPQYGLPLKIVSYKDLYGWTMDEIVKMIGLKNNCTFCGVFRRQV